MATVLSTLYPPLIDTFMPAFPYDESATVDFSISPYNTANMIKYLHVSLVNQKTNQNAFEGSDSGLEQSISGTRLINGVWILPFQEIDGILHCDSDNLWHLTIPTVLLKNQDNKTNKTFTIDYYYKLQLRFDNSSINNFNRIDASYLTTNRVFFSEWSSVCLLKAIPHIHCLVQNFTNKDVWNDIVSEVSTIKALEEGKLTPQYVPGSINLTGFLLFSDGSSNNSTNHGEYLKSYYISIFDNENIKIFQSEVQYTALLTEKNDFSYLLDISDESTFPTGQSYYLQFTFTTNNNYSFTETYQFSIIDYALADSFQPVWNFKTRPIADHGTITDEIITEEDGIIEFTVNCGSLKPGYLYIKRKSSLDNFKSAELICCVGFLGGNEDDDGNYKEVYYSVKDDTVGSLIRYRYSVQYQTLNNQWSRTVYSQDIYPIFHDILIKDKDKQLAIRYNAQISNMTPVVNRVKIDTLGGKYPKFAENARLNYKQLNISGLITAESDYNRTFLNELASKYESELIVYDNYMNGKYMIRNDTVVEDDGGSYGTYKEWILNPDTTTKDLVKRTKVGSKYDAINNNLNTDSMTPHDLYPRDNWWWERIFREEVIKWLNNGEPKLWRSMTEGNMVVMLDGISLTPNAQLGRRIWNFSATVYEVEDGYSLQKLDSLGLYSVLNDYNQNMLEGIYEQSAVTNYQVGQQYGIQGTTDGTSIRELILKQIQMNYEGLNSSYQVDPESVFLNSVKIQFHDDRIKESVPQWYDLDSLTNVDDSIDISIFTLNSEGELFPVENISWSQIINNSSTGSSYYNEDQTLLTANEILTWYLNKWETIIPKGNMLLKIRYLENDGVYDKTNVENITTTEGTKVSALASDVYSVIQKIKNKATDKYNYGLGYKLIIEMASPYAGADSTLQRTIFVNEHGYYQVPSDINVLDIKLFDNQIATIDYLVQWDITYNDLKDPSGYEIGEDIVGQVSGWWSPNTNISELIYNKYYYHNIEETISSYIGITQELEYWKASDFDVTPYTVLAIKQVNSSLDTQNIVVGRTGTLRLGNNFPINVCSILGRRMFRTTADRQPYLDEWEYVLDDSVFSGKPNSDIEVDSTYWYQVIDNTKTDILVKVLFQGELTEEDDTQYSVWDEDDFWQIYEDWYTLGENFYKLSSVKKPQYNTVYGLIDDNGIFSYKLYYIDDGWYDVTFEDENKTTMLAKVPINGVINYKGSLIKKNYT